MIPINNYDNFLLYNILEQVDHEWNYENGIEIDHRNKIIKYMTTSFDNAKDKKSWFKNLLTKLKSKKRIFKLAILTLLTPILLMNMTNDEVVNISNSVDPHLTASIVKLIDNNKNVKTWKSIPKYNVKDLNPSKELKDFIKSEEKLRLTAYDIGDGHITMGYGSARPIDKSKIQVGETITKHKAEELFKQDLSRAERGVKRLFTQWERKGIFRKVTQAQFDAMVSMAYNMGVGGFRSTEFVLLVKQNRMIEAGELIKITRLKSGYSGLIKRRNKEYKIFTRDI